MEWRWYLPFAGIRPRERFETVNWRVTIPLSLTVVSDTSGTLELAVKMQTLGLSDSTPRTESRWRALLWPTIRNEGDFDYITAQGLWICFVVAALTVVFSALAGSTGNGSF